VTLAGSELIGLVAERGISKDVSKVDDVIRSVGLGSVKPFSKDTSVLEHILSGLNWEA